MEAAAAIDDEDDGARVRLVGCALPVGVAREAGSPAKGVVTLSVPHVLASAATQRRLPLESMLVRVRWGHEARGSIFRPTLLAAGREEMAATAVPTLEMVYPVGVDAPRFLSYLREIKELALDVLDRSTRCQIGRCTVPLFRSPPRRRSNPPPSPPQETAAAGSAVETVLRQVRRENELHEIKAVASDREDDGGGGGAEDETIGYLVVNLDVHFRANDGVRDDEHGFLDDEVVTPSARLTAPLTDAEERVPTVLVPRASPTVRVRVQRHVSTVPRSVDAREGARLSVEFDAAEPSPSLPDTDASSLSQGSSSLRHDLHLSAGGAPSRRETPASPPLDPPKLLELLEKGKVLQRSMAKAADDDGWSGGLDHLAAIGIGGDLNSQIQKITGTSVFDDASVSASEDDSSTWQSILKRAQSSPRHVAHMDRLPPPTPVVSPQPSEALGLKISFDSIGFTREFAARLQQLRDSSMSSRFSPVELAVTHSDVAVLLATFDDHVETSDNADPLFSFTPSLQKRAFRLSYSHVVPLPTRDHLQIRQLMLRSSKKQLEFSVECKTQGTPRRNKQTTKGGRSPQISLRGLVAADDVFPSHEPTTEPRLVKVYLTVREASSFTRGTGAIAKRTREVAQRVGVLKVKFQVYAMKVTGSDMAVDRRDSRSLESSLRSSRHGSVIASSSEVSNSLFEPRRSVSPRAKVPYQPIERGGEEERSDRTRQVATQLGVMIDRAISLSVSDTQVRNGRRGATFVRFQYAVPHTKSDAALHPTGSFKRSFKRKLVRVGTDHGRSSRLSVNVGHVGVFPFEAELLSSHNSESKLLIVEVWLQQEQDARNGDGVLLGLVRVPLSTFHSKIRFVLFGILSVRCQLQTRFVLWCSLRCRHGCTCRESSRDGWDRPLPVVGVDDRFAVIDPFFGQTSGFVYIRVAVGTAEQMISLTKALRGIIQLQAMARAVLSRRIHFGRVRHVDRRHAARSSVTFDQHPWKVPSSSDEVRRNGDALAEGAADTARDEEKTSESVDTPIAPPKDTSNPNSGIGISEGSLAIATWHEIGLEIRECWRQARSAIPSHPVQVRKGSPPVLGCEVEGELVLRGDQDGSPTEVAFALWWDASHDQLNSRFEHSFRSRRSAGSTDLESEVSDVNLRFQVQTNFLRSSDADARQGHAVLSLRDMLGGVVSSKDGFRSGDRRDQLAFCEKELDVPIKWQDDSISQLARVFPVRVWYRVVSRVSAVSRPFEPALSTASSHTLGDSELKRSHIENFFPAFQDKHIGEPAPSMPAIADDRDDLEMRGTLSDSEAETLQKTRDNATGGEFRAPDPATEPGYHRIATDTPARTDLSELKRSPPASSRSEDTPAPQHSVLDQNASGFNHDESPRCHGAEEYESGIDLATSSAESSLGRHIDNRGASTELESTLGVVGCEQADLEPTNDEEQPRPTDSRLEIADLSFLPHNEPVDFYPPITLSSFGIEELQLSPLSESASSQLEMANNNAKDPVEAGDNDSRTVPQVEDFEPKLDCDSGNHVVELQRVESPGEVFADDSEGFSAGAEDAQVDWDALDVESDVSRIRDADAEESEPEPTARVIATQDARVQTDGIEVGPAVVMIDTKRLMVDAACGMSDDDSGSAGDDLAEMTAEDVCERHTTEGEVSVLDADTSASLPADDDPEALQAPAHSSLKNDDASASHSSPPPPVPAVAEATTPATQPPPSPSPPSPAARTAYVEPVASPSSRDGEASSSVLADPPQQVEPSFSLPADKFELICQLLTEIRDACGAERVREIIAAHTAHVTQFEHKAAKPAAGTVATTSRRRDNAGSIRAREAVGSASDDLEVRTKSSEQLPMSPGATERESLEQSTSASSQVDAEYVDTLDSADKFYYTATEQHEQAAASPSEAPKREHHPAYASAESSVSDVENFARQRQNTKVATTAEMTSPLRSRVQTLKPLHWSDSHSLRHEMQRRLERSGSDADRRVVAVSVVACATQAESSSHSRYEERLFANAGDLSAFTIRSRPTRKPLLYKADSETERIARIMQGSINYWRKGDEHAITSDDDSADSDSDDDLYF